ncbi:MAG: YegS/Rv2252/BmrU family lipid kinase [Firmicutes bacterium]|nr:YegS/Rv2252/BmrU family lipid kinase [Bacillota bacterium]
MYHIVINPKAGGRKSRKQIALLYNYLKENGIEHRMYFSEKSKHMTDIAAKLTSGGKSCNLVVMGGDGTFNEALAGIADFKNTTVGFVPSGSGNDFAKMMGLKLEAVAAFEDILKAKTGSIDYIECGKLKSINVVSTGLDTEVLIKYNNAKVFRGKIAYMLALLITLLCFKFYKFHIKADDKEYKGEYVLAACCNGSGFGGGIPVSPRSDITDGLINLVMIKKIKKIRIPLLLLKLLRGKHLGEDWAEEVMCKTVSIKTLGSPELLETDGELYDNAPFEAKVVAGGLKVFLPG